jgi:hypothetical protein
LGKIFFRIFGEDLLQDIWRGSSSGYLERIFFRIFGEGCHCNKQCTEDYFPEAIYSKKYGTELPWKQSPALFP